MEEKKQKQEAFCALAILASREFKCTGNEKCQTTPYIAVAVALVAKSCPTLFLPGGL